MPRRQIIWSLFPKFWNISKHLAEKGNSVLRTFPKSAATVSYLSVKKSGRCSRPESRLFRRPITSVNNIRRVPRRRLRRKSISSSRRLSRSDKSVHSLRHPSSTRPTFRHKSRSRRNTPRAGNRNNDRFRLPLPPQTTLTIKVLHARHPKRNPFLRPFWVLSFYLR